MGAFLYSYKNLTAKNLFLNHFTRFPYNQFARQLDLQRRPRMLPQKMLQNRSTIHAHMISWCAYRCQRRCGELRHIDIIKAYDGNILRNADSMFCESLDRTKCDGITCCKDCSREFPTLD